MEEETNSWIRRVKFSHTIYHRVDSSRLSSYPMSRLGSFPVTHRSNHDLGFGSQSGLITVDDESGSHDSQILRNPITKKQKSVSPLPKIILPNTFKEARTDHKRFSSPHLRRKEHEKIIARKSVNEDFHVMETSDSVSSSSSGPLNNFSYMKSSKKSKSKKDSAWTKYFDHGAGKVTAVKTMDDWTIDLSKLFLGIRFACGAHSRLYRGVYKNESVAVKMIRLPRDD
ncbi:hypothetical protein GIB67_028141 [Kingdonia uniflora]|uniref:Uncharacterized protein n=1 Tax=Kingdonia uniflora TaxID=39325 RepID=A0A7J7KZU4_9MAGN|nr:hypothetical protein GIB67_028141 [Kingdonia uniflora]